MMTNSTPHIDPALPSAWKTIAFGVTAVVLTIVGLLSPIPFSGRVAVAVGDMFHAPLFGGLTLGTLLVLQRFAPLSRNGVVAGRAAIVAGCLFAFGVVMELTQDAFGRTGTVHDAVANGLGIVAAVCAFAAWWSKQDGKFTRVSIAWLTLAGVLVAFAWWKPIKVLRDIADARNSFPRLGSFESSVEIERWFLYQSTARLTTKDAIEGQFALELAAEATQQPRATLLEMESNWSAMETLELDVVVDESLANDIAKFRVAIVERKRTYKPHAINFSKTWNLTPGKPQHLVITRGEIESVARADRPDMSDIQFLDLIVLEPSQPTTVRIDAVKLTLAPDGSRR